MLKLVVLFFTYFTNTVYFDNLLGGDFMAQGFIHTPHSISSAYDNPALLGMLKNIYAFTTESPRNNTTFYIDTKGRSKSPIQGIVSPKFALYYRKVYALDVRVDSPYFVDKERYSEYALSLVSSNKSTSLGINLKYLTGLYAYAHSDSAGAVIILDFAKGFTQDLGIHVNARVFSFGAAYNNIYGYLWWEDTTKVRLPSKFFITAGLHPFHDILFLNAEYEKNSAYVHGTIKGNLIFNIPYKPHGWKTSISLGYLKTTSARLITYGFTIDKGALKTSFGFDNKGNLAVTLYTSGQ